MYGLIGISIDPLELETAEDAEKWRQAGEARAKAAADPEPEFSDWKDYTEDRIAAIEKRLEGINNRDASADLEANLGKSWLSAAVEDRDRRALERVTYFNLVEKVEALESQRRIEGREWREWRKAIGDDVLELHHRIGTVAKAIPEIARRVKMADRGVGSLEHRDEEKTEQLTAILDQLKTLDGQIMMIIKHIRSGDSEGIRGTRAYDPSRSPTKSVSPPPRKPDPEAIGGPLTGFDSEGKG